MESTGVVSMSVPPLIWGHSIYYSVSNKICLFINTTMCFTVPFHSTEITVTGPIEIFIVVFCFGLSPHR